MMRKLLIFSVFLIGFSLTSCGSKKPKEKVDHSQVDKAYDDFNQRNR